MIRAYRKHVRREQLPTGSEPRAIHIEPTETTIAVMGPADAAELWRGVSPRSEKPVEIDVSGDVGYWFVVGIESMDANSITEVSLVRWLPRLDGFAAGLRKIREAMVA